MRSPLPILVLLLVLGGCAPHRVVTPVFLPKPGVQQRDLRRVALDICEFTVTNRARSDAAAAVDELRNVLRYYLYEAADYGMVTDCRSDDRSRATDLERVTAAVRIVPAHDTARSWFLDALFFYPFSGFFPVTPLWGRAGVRAEVRLQTAKAKLDTVEVRTSAPYSMVFFSWYRTRPVEDAYRRSYDATFRELGQRVARRIEEQLTTAQPPEATSDEEILALAMQLLETEEIRLPEEGLRIIAEPIARSDNLIYRYLGSLGGLEASQTGGTAIVESRAITEAAGAQTVGSGRAVSSGFRFALFRPPDRTGFFFPPRFGFFSQDIEISGFRDALPLSARAGRTDIPAVISDPATGVPVDIDEPISYALRLKSGYVGQGLGFNFVLGTDDLQLFSTVQAAVNAFEVRHTGVTINRTDVSGYSAEFFGSGQVTAQLGFAVPSIHLAVRGAWEFEWFRSFDYPEPLEFQASVAFNPEKMVFERQRVFVEGASVFTFNWQVSAIYTF